MPATTTQLLQIYTPKFEADRIRQQLVDAANEHDLTVEALTGSRGVLGYRLNVTVTGSPEEIEAFHRLYEGDGWTGLGGGSDVADFVLGPILAAVLGDGQRSLASRLRRRKMQRQAAANQGGAKSDR